MSEDAPPVVDVRRSARRRRTVSARLEADRIIVQIPASFTAAQERAWVAKMVARLSERPPVRRSDAELRARAHELSVRYLNGRARPTSVRWVADMRTRWASCTPEDGTIRIGEALRAMPGWVLDYVLVHELAHLLVPGHGPRFWALVENYPRSERARGYLQGVARAGDGQEID